MDTPEEEDEEEDDDWVRKRKERIKRTKTPTH